MAVHKFSIHAAPGKASFRLILARSRRAAAEQAWQRATLASVLRYAAADATSQRTLGQLKIAALKRARELAPGSMTIGIDNDFQLGLPTIQFSGGPRLHITWAAVSEVGFSRQMSVAG